MFTKIGDVFSAEKNNPAGGHLAARSFENAMNSCKNMKIQASIAWSHFLTHIRKFGTICTANSKELRPTVDERGDQFKIMLEIR